MMRRSELVGRHCNLIARGRQLNGLRCCRDRSWISWTESACVISSISISNNGPILIFRILHDCRKLVKLCCEIGCLQELKLCLCKYEPSETLVRLTRKSQNAFIAFQLFFFASSATFPFCSYFASAAVYTYG